MSYPMKDVKVLVLDIDGTLVTSDKEISPETKRGLLSIQKRGHKVILASGRPTPGVQRYVKELELEKYGGYTLTFNGGKIVNCRTGNIIYEKILPNHVIPGLYRYAKQNGCGIITYLGDQIILGTQPDEYIELESAINGMPVKKVDNFASYVDFDVNKCLMTAPPERAAIFEGELRKKYGDILSIYRSEPFFIEIMPKNVDKAASLDRMLESVGLTRENAICCGDGYNDITMLQYAGVGVAMGNAQEPVKKVADYLAGSNDENGIVDVLKRYIL